MLKGNSMYLEQKNMRSDIKRVLDEVETRTAAVPDAANRIHFIAFSNVTKVLPPGKSYPKVFAEKVRRLTGKAGYLVNEPELTRAFSESIYRTPTGESLYLINDLSASVDRMSKITLSNQMGTDLSLIVPVAGERANEILNNAISSRRDKL